MDVRFRPRPTETILVPATFGLLVSSDGGDDFSYVCESAIGYTGTYDPAYAVAANGAIYATTFDGLRVSRDGGCSFELLGGPLSRQTFVSDVEIGPDERIWATTATGGAPNDVYLSTDGSHFSPVGLEQDVWWLSIEVAPGNANRLYLSGHRLDAPASPAILYRSIDGGTSWTELPTADLGVGSQQFLHLLAVSPTDPRLLFARVTSANGPSADALYRSTNGGRSWTRALDFADRLSAFVIRRDGATVIAGSSAACPGEPAAPDKGCVRISDDGGASWRAPTSQPKMACLGERSDGTLYACGANWEPDMFALARSDDGESWHRVVRFSDITGPLECPADTIQASECAGDAWSALCLTLGICDPPADAGPDRPHTRRDDDSTGYYCSAGGTSSTGGLALLVAILLVARSTPRRRVRPDRPR